MSGQVERCWLVVNRGWFEQARQESMFTYDQVRVRERDFLALLRYFIARMWHNSTQTFGIDKPIKVLLVMLAYRNVNVVDADLTFTD